MSVAAGPSPHGLTAARARTLRAIALAFAATVCFTIVPICVRYLSAWMPPAEIVFFRNFLGFLLLMPWAAGALHRSGWGALAPGAMRFHLLRALLNGVGMIIWFWALARMPLADAVALQFTLPLWSVVFAVAFLGERVGSRRIAALLIGFGGVLIILRPGLSHAGLPAFAALTAAALYASVIVVVRHQSHTLQPTVIMFYTTLFMALVGLGPALLEWRTPPAVSLPWLAALGIVGFLAQYMLAHALRLAEAKVVIPLDFLRMPMTAAAAFVLFGEFPDLWSWVGVTVIFATTYAVARRDAKMGQVAGERAAKDRPAGGKATGGKTTAS